MDFKLDARMVGLRALQQEIVDRSGWNANLGWKRRHAGASLCGLGFDLARGMWSRWRAIIKVGPTPDIVKWELGKSLPALWSFLLLIYYLPTSHLTSPGYRMIRKKRIIRYNYGGYSKLRAHVPVAR